MRAAYEDYEVGGFLMVGKFDVTGMTCSACSAHVEKSVSKLEGVDKVSVNLLTNSMQAEYNEDIVNENDIINAVISAGYGASVKGRYYKCCYICRVWRKCKRQCPDRK